MISLYWNETGPIVSFHICYIFCDKTNKKSSLLESVKEYYNFANPPGN